MGADYVVLSRAAEYLETLSENDRAVLHAHIHRLNNREYEKVRTKKLTDEVHELIVGAHRITYCMHDGMLCCISALRKKSQKTPRTEIEYAVRIQTSLTQHEN